MKKQQKIIIISVVIIALAVILILSFSSNKQTSIQETQKNVDFLGVEPQYSTISENINYYKRTQGYLAKPETEGNYPGVIMIHEWWGLNENIKEMADKLASQGYIVLAVDLYDGEFTDKPSFAGQYASKVRNNPQEAINNMMSAIAYLKSYESVEKIASLGWCFGGQQSLQISLNENVDATVIYYGNLVTDKEQLSSLEGPVLGIFGSNDTSIPVATVNEFQTSLNELNIENDINIYEGVGHAFANPSGVNYAPEETRDAWDKTLNFLENNLK